MFPLTFEVIWSASVVRSEPGHFVETAITLRLPIVTLVHGYCLESVVPNKWLLCWYDRGVGANRSELRVKPMSEYTGVNQYDGQSSIASRQRWPMATWQIWVRPCNGEGRGVSQPMSLYMTQTGVRQKRPMVGGCATLNVQWRTWCRIAFSTLARC